MSKEQSTWKRLLSYARPHRRAFFFIFLLIFLATILEQFQPKIVQLLIDEDLAVLLAKKLPESLVELHRRQIFFKIFLYFINNILVFTLLYGMVYFLNKTGQAILHSIRTQLYDHLIRMPMSFYDKNATGSLLTRVSNDTESVNELFTTVFSSSMRNLFRFVGILFIMFQMNVLLASLVLALTPVIILVSVVFRNTIRKVYQEQRKILAMINSKLSENISGMNLIRYFHKEADIYQEFDQVNADYLDKSYEEVRDFAIYRPVIEIIRSLGLSLILWFGGHSYLRGIVSFGVLVAFIDYIQRFFQPILEMAETFNVIQSAMTSMNRIFFLLDQEEEDFRIDMADQEKDDQGFHGTIEFQHVYFRYNKEDDWVIRDLSFKIEAGQFVAFVGATGAGKSTIMSLIMGFYEIEKGEILIDGKSIKEYSSSYLRKHIGVVQQDVFLFSGNIVDNITMKRKELGLEEARKAGALVHANGFIEELPKAYEEKVTERGSTLSAGQRQLLSFARTMASNPSILILDEATANIDTETEILIQKAINKMSMNRTMIAVAHRISTVSDADYIYVMDHGKIVEAGNKDELIEQDGLFRVLYELQYQEA